MSSNWTVFVQRPDVLLRAHLGGCTVSPRSSLFTFTSGMFGTLASHAHFLTDSLSLAVHGTPLPPPSTTAPTPQLDRGSPCCSHLRARLQPLVHLVDPILGLDHVRRVSPVERSERGRVERVMGWVGHGGSWRGARRGFSVRRAQRRTWECDALRRPPVGESRCRG